MYLFHLPSSTDRVDFLCTRSCSRWISSMFSGAWIPKVSVKQMRQHRPRHAQAKNTIMTEKLVRFKALTKVGMKMLGTVQKTLTRPIPKAET